MPALELESVCKRFGALSAIDGVSFAVEPGERVALVGPNGAGKTTLFNLISGELPPDSGTVRLGGRDVTRHTPEKMAREGLGRTFQRNSLFMESTVYENVRLAVQARAGVSFQMLRPITAYSRLGEETERVLELVRLSGRAGVRASELSYGEQRQLELGIALATGPRVLLLDEPTAGMSAQETGEMVAMLKELPGEITLLIVEHDMDVVGALARRILVLNFGRLIADGPLEEVRRNEEVLAAYLGVGEEVRDA
ncbi:ABC transporter ATP-binding protein [Rubrobacter taiwanensis]|jgi:branched-chain amino acid transport system ATP-binding protein|uniref:ABC transporter ATP-binding protein n=1 Tax=Rubrobacter taiwanensis TaxID=185139 RepID=A0A4R1BCU8_9ACTN|nr:ABC transporter ATP-binding protein [Rubrobacter taiwanensis]TCJ14844.1 ABC transporter ATP-binding protein [Rubrobacter taiwanensis]